MRICILCGQENSDHNTTCKNCYFPLGSFTEAMLYLADESSYIDLTISYASQIPAGKAPTNNFYGSYQGNKVIFSLKPAPKGSDSVTVNELHIAGTVKNLRIGNTRIISIWLPAGITGIVIIGNGKTNYTNNYPNLQVQAQSAESAE